MGSKLIDVVKGGYRVREDSLKGKREFIPVQDLVHYGMTQTFLGDYKNAQAYADRMGADFFQLDGTGGWRIQLYMKKESTADIAEKINNLKD